MSSHFRDLVRGIGGAPLAELVAGLDEDELLTADDDWLGWAHDGQREPAGDWRTWVIMAGRGFGKTRAGAEWIARAAREDGALRIALVAASYQEARAVMVEGQSGLLSIAGDEIAEWVPSQRMLRFASGAEARLYSGAHPPALRGPEHHLAWCDELAKWRRGAEAWDMLQLGLRLGRRPRALVTTTPRPCEILKRILAQPGTHKSGGHTAHNPHLPDAFVETVTGLYAGTRLGRQELAGELLPDTPGALWTIDLLERCRTAGPSPLAGEGDSPSGERGEGRTLPLRDVEARRTLPLPHPGEDRTLPLPQAGEGRGEGRATRADALSALATPFARTVIGVDPPAGDGTCGIIACALAEPGAAARPPAATGALATVPIAPTGPVATGPVAYVLADHSVTARSPEGWARAVAAAAQAHNAQLIVAEANQGGRMVETVLRAAGIGTRLKLVHATQGKSARADPIATLFEAGRVRLAGVFPELEAELCGLIAGGGYEGPGASPDRADAMVWALTELMMGGAGVPRVRGL